MGRKPSGVPHRKPIQVKLSEDERAYCDERAKENNVDTSTWMRQWCMNAPPKVKRKVVRR